MSLNLLRIAVRIASVDKSALPKEWRLITDQQIRDVMKRMPQGAEIYGSYANGKSGQGSDLDIKLPDDIGENTLSKLMVKTMKDLDLKVGSINISMPCSEHSDWPILTRFI